LVVVSRENQNLTNEIMRVVSERDDLKEQLSRFSLDEKRVRQDLRAIELEKSNILTNYQNLR
jgi:hypothetical protein